MNGSRAIGLWLLAVLGSVLSTGLSPLTSFALPDFALLVALYAGLTSRHSGGVVAAQRDASALGMLSLGAAMGYASDLVEGTPHGLRALGMALLTTLNWVLVARWLRSRWHLDAGLPGLRDVWALVAGVVVFGNADRRGLISVLGQHSARFQDRIMRFVNSRRGLEFPL